MFLARRFPSYSRFHLTLTGLIVLAALRAAAAQTVPSGFIVSTPVTGISQPITCTFVAHNDLLVLTKDGNVHHVQNGVVSLPILTLAVSTSSERGLLGIARHPDFTPTSGFIYLYYTNLSPLEHRITRYTWNGSALTTPTPIATLPAPPGPNHDGGIILFGPDRKLYAIIGDLNRDEKTQNYEASPLLSETGVILRLNDDGSTPSDNPLDATAGWERMYAYGIRNSFGMAFDELTGTLWDTENGPGDYDEVNRIPPGFNSGWEDIMGPDSRDPQNVSNLLIVPGAAYVDPEFSWVSTVAPTAIRFLHSPRFAAAIRDSCFVGDNNNGNLYRYDMNPARTGFVLAGGLTDKVADDVAERNSVRWGFNFSSITDLQIGPDGYLYVVSIGSGNIYRIRPQFPMGDLNQDGTIDSIDRVAFINLLLGLPAGPVNPALADFDGNGQVNGADTQLFIESFLLPQ